MDSGASRIADRAGTRSVATPLPSGQPAPSYLDFFGMERAPFSGPTAPSEIFHSDQYSLLDSHLADAANEPGSLILVCGADGAGKTTLLNKHVSGLGDDLCYATFDATCTEGLQFYSSFLAQIGFGEVRGSLHELQGITREFLIHCARSGRPVLLFLDDAQLARPAVLEQLRSAGELRKGNEHVISIVLAGNSNLPRIVDSPAMGSLKFRHETRFHVRAYSEIETNDYVRHQLTLAKASQAANFSDGSFALIYRFTGGIPGAINRLCHAVLAECCAQGTRAIDEHRIRSVAAANRFIPRVMSMRGKRRRKTDCDLHPDTGLHHDEERSLQDLVIELENERGSTQRARAALSQTREALRDLERENAQLQAAINALHADLLASARAHEKAEARAVSLEALRRENSELRRQPETRESPKQLVAVQVDRTAEVKADQDAHRGESGGPTVLELFLDGKLTKVVDIAGCPSQLLVGRAHDCELRLDSRFVSRHHALISCNRDGIVVEDLNSANGVFVDSMRVSRSEVHPGNTVSIGNFRLLFKRGRPVRLISGSADPATSVAT